MCSPHNNDDKEEQEYVDYSCSTAVERLTRDVESLLRSWHVHDGCDRHFSVSTDPNGLTLLRAERLTWVATLPTPTRQRLQMELELALWDGPATRAPQKKKATTITRRQSDGSSTSLPLLLKKKEEQKEQSKQAQSQAQGDNNNNNRRSSVSNDECVKNVMKKCKDSIVLAVCQQQDDTSISLDSSEHSLLSASLPLNDLDAEDEDDDNELHKHLPKSLQRPHHPADITDMPDSLFDNFSTMFGIGQHITLTPTNPGIDLGIEDNNSGSGSDWSNTALGSFCNSILGRHKPHQARWVLTQLLASWLQTALNCAAINCQSCIPVFGLWGHYPSAKLPSSQQEEKEETANNNNIASSGYWNQNHIRKQASISIFPPWLDVAQALKGSIDSVATAMDEARDLEKPLPRARSFGSIRRRNSKRLNRSKSEYRKDLLPISTSMTKPWLRNDQHLPPVITGSVIPTKETHANFICSVLPEKLLEGPVDKLSTWGDLLLHHCSSRSGSASPSSSASGQDDVSVVLSGALHVYSWSKSKIPESEWDAWRGIDPKEYWKQQQRMQQQSSSSNQTTTADLAYQSARAEWEAWRGVDPREYWKQQQQQRPSQTTTEIEAYRSACRAHALKLLEEATGATCWGPRLDPIYALQASVGWKSQSVFTDDSDDEHIEPLGSFPSPTQCSAYCTSSSLLDPQKASFFKVQTFLDHMALEPTLATNVRCVLACLIRTSTLAPLTLLRHLLWEEDIIEDWDHHAGNRAALRVARKALVGEATTTLVDVMDWAACAEDMIHEKDANAIISAVLEGTSSFGFPSPPDDMFSTSHQQQKFPLNNKSHSLLEPLFQSAPVGRLVSNLFARMAQLRTPCSMALVWSTFCNELRERWEVREPLSRMNFVAGLDPSPAVLAERRKVSTIGVKATLAAFLNSSEPDPDDQHCLIGQKLQVFNIGIETMAVMEESRARQHACEHNNAKEGSSWRDLDPDAHDGSSSPTPARANSLVSLASDTHPSPQEIESTSGGKVVNLSSFGRLQIPSDLFRGKSRNEAIIDGLLPHQNSLRGGEEKEEMSIITGADSLSEFFDAEECGMSVFTSTRSIFSRNLAATAVHRIERKGARCPLHGCSLVATGDQVYAPYLRRPEPLTDDIILERRTMLSEDYYVSEMTANDGRTPIQRRLEIAYRLQKPKLLSDMNAFKAANPGAIFQDFVSWYGNPGNPLEDYCPHARAEKSKVKSHTGLASAETAAEKATEAIHILNETRSFWSSTWDEAEAIPASEQEPLYEVLSTVEMTLDYLENMHPAILLNQVMAVTLANSYFLLVASAKDAVNVPVVESALQSLREKTEQVLAQLAEEASNATRVFYNMQCDDAQNKNKSFVSISAINKCERVCSCFSEAEVMVALATSLLQKFPGQYETVQCILKHADGDKVELEDPVGQTRILDAIARQQRKPGQGPNRVPKPVLREYLFRNLDDAAPCQLSVRYGDASLCTDDSEATGDAGLLIALTKSATND